MMAAADYYDGPVCYRDGWHWTVADDGEPGDKLHLEDTADGSESRYRLATDADTRSWHDRKHRQFQTFDVEGDVQPAVAVTADEMAAINDLLEKRRSGT